MGFLIKVSSKKIEEIQYVLDIALEQIVEGKIIAFPTDSVYGIGGDPKNLDVIEKIFQIKFRDRSKGLLLLVYDLEEAKKIAEFNEMAEKLANHFWPGQLTLILKRKIPNIIPAEVTAFQDTIGIRVPSNEIIRNILLLLKKQNIFGGLIGTSANYSNEPPAISGDEIAKKFLTPIDLIIDGGKSKSKIPTTIVDCTTNKPKFLRIGLISEEEIINILNQN
ncbi:MAG: threonylcarbamoyl-AMP synthase [Candidatus Lokiarchaeota archaeon]|nr:threonylcarbamoyl-AMP synthase [Candidatus Lokiarchaeota archaeon]